MMKKKKKMKNKKMMNNKKNSGRRPRDEIVERVLASFLCSPQKSTKRAGGEFRDVSHMTVWKVLRKRLSSQQSKFQLLLALKPNNGPRRDRPFYRCAASNRNICFWLKLTSVTKLPLTYQER
jgi:hypothetical protein